MIEFENFVFAAPERTGRGWFLKAAELVGLNFTGTDFKMPKFKPTKLSVSLVRHPYDWIESVYSNNDVYHEIGFEPFVRACASYRHGLGFHQYITDTSMRLEDFPWCVMEFFQSMGVDDQKINLLRDLKPINVRTQPIQPANESLRRWLVEKESAFCEAYNYW